ncbi:MAG: hypothetical protein WCI67_18080 [Chloroflexales bacterium]
MTAAAREEQLRKLRAGAERLSAYALASVLAYGDDVLAAEPWRRRFLRYRAAAVAADGELRGMPPLRYD